MGKINLNFLRHRLSGISPFWGGNEEMTSSKVDLGTWQFDDGAFQGSSDEAKQFITNLLVKNPMYVIM